MKRRFLIASIALSGCAAVPEPPAVTSANVPQRFAGFAGRWSGIWDGVEDNTTRLIVTNISENGEISGQYYYQANPAFGFRTQITNGSFVFGSGVRFTFTLLPDGRLSGERRWSGGTNRTILSRA